MTSRFHVHAVQGGFPEPITESSESFQVGSPVICDPKNGSSVTLNFAVSSGHL